MPSQLLSALLLCAGVSHVSASCAHGTYLQRRQANGAVKINTFSYQGATGPLNWVSLDPAANAACGAGRTQSPIDMVNGQFTLVPPAALNLNVQDIPRTEFENLGTTVEVIAPAGGGSITVNGTQFALKQFHFHHPSEHLDAGTSLALEMHMVFESAAREISVVGVYFDPVEGGQQANGNPPPTGAIAPPGLAPPAGAAPVAGAPAGARPAEVAPAAGAPVAEAAPAAGAPVAEAPAEGAEGAGAKRRHARDTSTDKRQVQVINNGQPVNQQTASLISQLIAIMTGANNANRAGGGQVAANPAAAIGAIISNPNAGVGAGVGTGVGAIISNPNAGVGAGVGGGVGNNILIPGSNNGVNNGVNNGGVVSQQATGGTQLLDTVFGSVGAIATPGTKVAVGPLSMAPLIQSLNQGNFQNYKGSLTTPPCSEGVNWFVSTQKQTISLQALAAVQGVINFNSRFPQNKLGQENVLALAARTNTGVVAPPVAAPGAAPGAAPPVAAPIAAPIAAPAGGNRTRVRST